VVGCLPLYPPVELFSSMGLLPVVLWNLKSETPTLELSDRHVQTYACGIARELVQFVASDQGACLDGIFSYNACDTLRNLPEIIEGIAAASERTLPMVRMHVPQVNRAHTDPDATLKQEILGLIEAVEWAFDVEFSAEAFQSAVRKYTKMRSLCLEAEKLVAKGALGFSQFCGTVLAGYALSVEEQTAQLLELISHSRLTASTRRADVLVSGIMPPPRPVMEAMEHAGLRVVANDIASLRRSYGYTPVVSDDPVAYYTDYFENKFPCTTLLYQSDRRIETVLGLVKSSGARGVVISGEKFCEYEYFEFPWLEARLKEIGVPVLRLEFGVDDTENTGAYTTRVDAFSELLMEQGGSRNVRNG
jgi:benzoyl-CoA reductase/2-hydroxyglutaryl-CoA dehydratase subunit BcrC/BadD/HgdB